MPGGLNALVGASLLATAALDHAMALMRKPLVWERPMAATGMGGLVLVVGAFVVA
jgi:hypothetical protein